MKVISIHLNSGVATQPEVLNLAISIDLPKQKNVCKYKHEARAEGLYQLKNGG